MLFGKTELNKIDLHTYPSKYIRGTNISVKTTGQILANLTLAKYYHILYLTATAPRISRLCTRTKYSKTDPQHCPDN